LKPNLGLWYDCFLFKHLRLFFVKFEQKLRPILSCIAPHRDSQILHNLSKILKNPFTRPRPSL
jgi:hypothetical protein